MTTRFKYLIITVLVSLGMWAVIILAAVWIWSAVF